MFFIYFVCLVCLFAGLHKPCLTDYHETWWEDVELVKKEPIPFGADLNKWAEPGIWFHFLCSISPRCHSIYGKHIHACKCRSHMQQMDFMDDSTSSGESMQRKGKQRELHIALQCSNRAKPKLRILCYYEKWKHIIFHYETVVGQIRIWQAGPAGWFSCGEEHVRNPQRHAIPSSKSVVSCGTAASRNTKSSELQNCKSALMQ